MKRRFVIFSASVAIACLFIAAAVFKGFSPLQAITFPLAPSTHELRDIGEPIATVLTNYYQEHRRYPATLADAGIGPAPTFYGPWEYQVLDGGNDCELSNGDYGRYFVVVSWTPKNGWYIDT